MSKLKWFPCVFILIFSMSACVSSSSSEESDQLARVERQLKDEEIGLSEMLRQKRAIYRAHSGLDEHQEAYFEKAISYAVMLEAGSITLDQFLVLEGQERENMELMREMECMKIRQENQSTNRTGLDSTNGFVAIVSMGALLADSAAEVKACS